ncbi:oligosaccharide flippase family protein [Neomoorella carbonis]|uniref:oligosaccharide flippase family protein n=1 Tax=Neomoorella carbonis TaxID=3062783 RepID=UPI0032468834
MTVQPTIFSRLTKNVLYQQAAQGIVSLSFRQLASIGISGIGTLILMRILGPREYGMIVIVQAIMAYLIVFGSSFGAYVVRSSSMEMIHDIFTLAVLLSFFIFGLLMILASLIAAFWGVPELKPLIYLSAAGVSFGILAGVQAGILEREMRYPTLAGLELASIILTYIIAIIMAWQGMGPLGVTLAMAGTYIIQFIGFKIATGYRWKPVVPKSFRVIIGYVFSYAASGLTWQLRSLINPIIVGRIFGPEMVGIIGAVLKVVEASGALRGPVLRVLFNVMSRVQKDKKELSKAIFFGTSYQILLLGLLYFLIALFLPLAVRLILGQQWVPVIEIYSWVAVAFLFQSIPLSLVNIFYVSGQNLKVLIANIIYIGLLALSTYVFVGRAGAKGYGWAEILSVIIYGLIIYLYSFPIIGTVRLPLLLASGLSLAIVTTKYISFWSSLLVFLSLLGRHDRQLLFKVFRGAYEK